MNENEEKTTMSSELHDHHEHDHHEHDRHEHDHHEHDYHEHNHHEHDHDHHDHHAHTHFHQNISTKALLLHMIEHNEGHAEELRHVAEKLDEGAKAKTLQAVALMDESNALLKEAAALLKEE